MVLLQRGGEGRRGEGKEGKGRGGEGKGGKGGRGREGREGGEEREGRGGEGESIYADSSGGVSIKKQWTLTPYIICKTHKETTPLGCEVCAWHKHTRHSQQPTV